MTKFMKLGLAATLALAMSVSTLGAYATEATSPTIPSTVATAVVQSPSQTPLTGEALEAHQKAMLEAKKAILAARVKAGTMTQAQADTIIKAIQTNQLTCDGTGNAKIGQSVNAQFGSGGQGQGVNGGNRGQGMGRGMGRGMGQGTCVAPVSN